MLRRVWQLPLWSVITVLIIKRVVAVAATAPPSCTASTPAGSFDLAPLGALRIVSREAASFGWTYLFSACADVDASVAGGHCRGMAPAVQATNGACFKLGSLSQRSVVPLAAEDRDHLGVTVAFAGGDSCGTVSRTISIDILCSDVARAMKGRVTESTTQACVYNAVVESRAGCPLSCGRDPMGAVCGGKNRGVCGFKTAGGEAVCICTRGHAGPHCSFIVASDVRPSSRDSAENSHAIFAVGIGACAVAAALAAIKCAQRSYGTRRSGDEVPAVVRRPLGLALCLLAGAGILLIQTCIDGKDSSCTGRAVSSIPRIEAPQQAASRTLPLCRDRPLLGPLVAHDEGFTEDGPWLWRPSTCHFRHFEPPAARECLKDRHLFFVGNSIAREVYGHALAYICEHGMRNRSAEKETCKSHNGCSERCEASLDAEFGIALSHFFVNRMSDTPPPGYRYHDPDLCGGSPSSCLATALQDSRPGDVLIVFSGVCVIFLLSLNLF